MSPGDRASRQAASVNAGAHRRGATVSSDSRRVVRVAGRSSVSPEPACASTSRAVTTTISSSSLDRLEVCPNSAPSSGTSLITGTSGFHRVRPVPEEPGDHDGFAVGDLHRGLRPPHVDDRHVDSRDSRSPTRSGRAPRLRDGPSARSGRNRPRWARSPEGPPYFLYVEDENAVIEPGGQRELAAGEERCRLAGDRGDVRPRQHARKTGGRKGIDHGPKAPCGAVPAQDDGGRRGAVDRHRREGGRVPDRRRPVPAAVRPETRTGSIPLMPKDSQLTPRSSVTER